jgi:hypothetical protein
MKKIKASRLSTVVEDPKLSSLVPILGSSHLTASRPSVTLSRDDASRLSSCQSLLRDHPAFRNQDPSIDIKNADGETAARSSLRFDGTINESEIRGRSPVSFTVTPAIASKIH